MDLTHAFPWLDSIFHLKVPVLEKFLRPMLVYLALIILVRVFGKRELAQLNPLDLVVLLSLSNTVQNAIIGDDNSFTGGAIGAFSLLSANYLVSRLLYQRKKWERVLVGSPTRLITDGIVDQNAMKQEHLTDTELLTVIHRQDFDDCSEVANCTLEASGSFFIQGRKPDAAERSQAELLSEIAKLNEALSAFRKEVGEALGKRVN